MIKRCPWLNLKNEDYVRYHDFEWGRPVQNDNKHFELLSLEGAQAGLNWEIILKKRDHFRKVFRNFNIKLVSQFSNKKLDTILLDPGVIRHRLKIYSVRDNARAIIKVQEEFGSFNDFIWSYTDNAVIYNKFEKLNDYPTKTSLSIQISKDLKRKGFKFIGPTTTYAYMQAAGIVQDHSTHCFLHNEKFTTK